MKRKKRVVVIEDDKFFSEVVCEMLTQRNFLPVQCFQMEDAIGCAGANQVAFIITDIFMPGMGGIEGIQVIKDQIPDTPIVAMSGGFDNTSADKTLDAAMKIGADAALSKPFSGSQLDQLLQDLGLAQKVAE